MRAFVVGLRISPQTSLAVVLVFGLHLAVSQPASGQQRPTFSIDFQGPSAGGGVAGGGLPDGFLGLPINEGDIPETGGVQMGQVQHNP